MSKATLMALGQVTLVSLLAAGVSILIAALVLRSLPVDYFSSGDRTRSRYWLLKNLAGWVLIIAGILLSFPGVPGQGVLTILAGVVLADFPKKMALERWLMRKPAIFRGANAIRRRFGRPDFLPPTADNHEAVFR